MVGRVITHDSFFVVRSSFFVSWLLTPCVFVLVCSQLYTSSNADLKKCSKSQPPRSPCYRVKGPVISLRVADVRLEAGDLILGRGCCRGVENRRSDV